MSRLALPRLHAVTNDSVLALPDFLERVRAVARGPEVAVHVRGRLPGRRLLALAEALREITAQRGAQLFVNDRADVARLAGADGVHLPADGLPVAPARDLSGVRWVGRSAHRPDEASAAARDGADYVFLGPIWPTTSHPERRPLGPEAIAEAQLCTVVAVGGVTPDRVAACIRAGASGVAAISALWEASDPAAAADTFLLSFT